MCTHIYIYYVRIMCICVVEKNILHKPINYIYIYIGMQM